MAFDTEEYMMKKRRKPGLFSDEERKELDLAPMPEIDTEKASLTNPESKLSFGDKLKGAAGSATSALGGMSTDQMNGLAQGGQMVANTVDPKGEGVATIGSSALSGAAMGTAVTPGIGTAIGAVVGLALGVVKTESNKKVHKAERELEAATLMGKGLQNSSKIQTIKLGSGINRDLKF